jgi:hypothetical protein
MFKLWKKGNAKETCHNKKMEETIIHVVPTKVVELVAKIITRPFKPTIIFLQYPLFILVLKTMYLIVLER